MTNTNPPARGWLVAVLLAAMLVSACAAHSRHPGQIDVTSEPPGAEVYVMGEKVGVTPLVVDQDVVFPTVFPPAKQALYGNIELRKAGCKDSVQPVSTRALARGLHVRLECDEAPAAARPGADKAGAAGESIESRLRRVQDLRDKGLITDLEARDIRQRILNDL